MSIRLTDKRKQILEILKKNRGSLSVADIHSKIPGIDLVTVYRNLDLFVKEKMIKKINLGTEESQYEYQDKPHHHAVCSNCSKVLHFTASDEKIKELIDVEGFQVDEIEVTVRGTCHEKKHLG
ncbi:transcriptional repressor [Candidatus Kaiserbacteria bacterium]|nr:transcriptional repressor [Candidatus Kaiserbacteria bacterium]USN92590.1 MAG: transcriptional repressor [Candidatus Nomurabacteria bacterium]